MTALLIVLTLAAPAIAAHEPRSGHRLNTYVFRATDNSFGVTATLIYGRTEAFLVDSEYHISQAQNLADRIAARNVRLKAIFITHPHDDHYIGLAVLHQRFPGTPIYMTSTALSEFKKTVEANLAGQKKYAPAETPDSVPVSEVLPSTRFTIDGRRIEIFPDLQGDYAARPANSFVWIPSLRTVVAGDITFSGVHPWLRGSTKHTRSQWRKSLDRIARLHPQTVISGHKKDSKSPDTPQVIGAMRQYLKDFDAARRSAATAAELETAMKLKYPQLGEERFLSLAANSAFRK